MTRAGIEDVIGPQGIGLHLWQQCVGALQNMGLRQRIDKNTDIGAQPGLAAFDSFASARFLSAGTMLVSSHDRGIDHRAFVVRIGRQRLE